MEPADSIRRLGFARWYERRLIEGHAWFVSGVLCLITIGACVEEISYRGSMARLILYAVLIAAALAMGVYGMLRYQKLLTQAEELGELATCSGCGAYARFKFVSASQVCCRKCSHEWRLIKPALPD